MANIRIPEEHECSEESQAVFREFKQVRGVERVPPYWRAMGLHPEYLRTVWEQYKVVMGPGELSVREKEIIALAVSATNDCDYCIDSHTAALRRLGLGDHALMELMEVVDFFNGTNAFNSGLKIHFREEDN